MKFTKAGISKLEPETKTTEHYDTKQPGLGLRVSPKGKKAFVYRYYFAPYTRKVTLGHFPDMTIEQARIRCNELALQVSRGIDPAEVKRVQKNRPKETTLNDVIKEYKRIRYATLRPQTAAGHTYRIEKYIAPKFGKKPIKEITPAQVQNFLDTIPNGDKNRVQAERVKSVISAIFKFAIPRGYAERNPAEGIRFEKTKSFVRTAEYTPDELRALWASFDALNEPMQTLMKVLLLTGQRSGETKRMKWQDVQDGVWTKPKTETKNKHEHALPLPPLAAELIEALHPLTGHSAYVFRSPHQSRDEPVSRMHNAAGTIRKVSKVSDFRVHDLRHICTTGMASLKVPESIISRILNHASSSSITARYNKHDYKAEKRQALELWQERVQEIISGTA